MRKGNRGGRGVNVLNGSSLTRKSAMFIALIAALQSTIDSGINSTSLMITRDIRHVVFKNTNPDDDLKIGRYLTLAILLLAMCIAPVISKMGGIYQFIQTILSLFQGPMLALLLMGAFT